MAVHCPCGALLSLSKKSERFFCLDALSIILSMFVRMMHVVYSGVGGVGDVLAHHVSYDDAMEVYRPIVCSSLLAHACQAPILV